VLVEALQEGAAWLRLQPARMMGALAFGHCLVPNSSCLQTAGALHLCLAVILERCAHIVRLHPLHTGTDVSITW